MTEQEMAQWAREIANDWTPAMGSGPLECGPDDGYWWKVWPDGSWRRGRKYKPARTITRARFPKFAEGRT